MNEFQFTIQLEKINKATQKTYLKKKLTKYIGIANPYYRSSNNTISYSKTSNIEALQTAVYAKQLCKAIVNRYIDIAGSTAGLPQYASFLQLDILVYMQLEEALEWVKSKQDK